MFGPPLISRGPNRASSQYLAKLAAYYHDSCSILMSAAIWSSLFRSAHDDDPFLCKMRFACPTHRKPKSRFHYERQAKPPPNQAKPTPNQPSFRAPELSSRTMILNVKCDLRHPEQKQTDKPKPTQTNPQTNPLHHQTLCIVCIR